MAEVIKTITSLDGKKRVKIFQRSEGTFGFDEFFFDEEEQSWCMFSSRQRSYAVFDTLDRTLHEIAGRIPWTQDSDWFIANLTNAMFVGRGFSRDKRGLL